MATLFFNVGRKQLVTPADIVGKIAGVTRLPAEVVGAIDIHQRHTLVDVAEKPGDIDVARAEKAKHRALDRLQKKIEVDIVRAQAALSRAEGRLAMASRAR